MKREHDLTVTVQCKEIDLPQVPQTLDFTCGAACFESMYRYLRGGESLGELNIAKELGTLDIGYTTPEKIAELASRYGFRVHLMRDAQPGDLFAAVNKFHDVVFVTWWYEDSGHYSLVKKIADNQVTMMDPWMAREGKDSVIDWHEFLLLWRVRGSVLIKVQTLIS